MCSSPVAISTASVVSHSGVYSADSALLKFANLGITVSKLVQDFAGIRSAFGGVAADSPWRALKVKRRADQVQAAEYRMLHGLRHIEQLHLFVRECLIHGVNGLARN